MVGNRVGWPRWGWEMGWGVVGPWMGWLGGVGRPGVGVEDGGEGHTPRLDFRLTLREGGEACGPPHGVCVGRGPLCFANIASRK